MSKAKIIAAVVAAWWVIAAAIALLTVALGVVDDALKFLGFQ